MRDRKLLAEVARQVFAGADTVATPTGAAPVQRTSKQHLRRVEFSAGDERVVGIEQNPNTGSRWAQLAGEGYQVIQFRNARSGAYVANVVDGKVTVYHHRNENS